ncbi:PssE/Cps14G family polysaccharide biosynthesis glycosyltransferase [Vibrio campbellii]|uniref:PssE/Cps14G family polysaccharide biosynthesis glycosyltransferase n=1 Tax=Vibrio campbellii TaxID=680 RepID=UPI0037358238
MKIFVTVGTTPFDSLIKSIDEKIANIHGVEVTFQISDGNYKPKFGDFFNFSENINHYYKSSDVVITHAGAGSIYSLLESRVKTIIVPNLDRIDKHQIDIARFMENNGYASVMWDLKNPMNIVERAKSAEFNPYVKEAFFKVDEILDYIET